MACRNREIAPEKFYQRINRKFREILSFTNTKNNGDLKAYTYI